MMQAILVSGAAQARPAAVAEIEFSRPPGCYESPFELRINTTTPGAKIFYTTNGSVPSGSPAQAYTGPIQIRATAVIRAAGFKQGLAATEIATATYLFLRDVFEQRGDGFPQTWGTNQGTPVPASYAMAPEAVTNRVWRDLMVPALKSIPTLSIVMDPKELFDPAEGIYANPKEKGASTERSASAELIYPDGRRGFQINCGVRIQGGWNRRPEESPKHSFRLLFKKSYGPSKLKFPLFGDGVREFETITLRAGCNNTWLHWSGEERRRGDFIRDQWVRDTFGAMGHPSARGCFAHLYLNGLYWGLYNPTERPSAPFVAARLGGSPRDYDSMNNEKILEGDKTAWNAMFALANAGLAGRKEFDAMSELLDMPEFIDFMIVNLYGANSDWDHASNWYAARRRHPAGPFHFFIWDAERTLEAVGADTVAFDDDQSPPRLFQKLRANAEFRLQFADHVQRHFFNAGVLTPGIAAQRFQKWSQEIDPAIPAESARWGAYRRDVHPYKTGPYDLYTRDQHWRPEISRLINDYFPRRPAVALGQFRAAGLYPALAAPTVRSTADGVILAAPAGTIFFTQDGSDPRLVGGGMSRSASKYQSPIEHSSRGRIKARARADAGGEWSALVEF